MHASRREHIFCNHGDSSPSQNIKAARSVKIEKPRLLYSDQGRQSLRLFTKRVIARGMNIAELDRAFKIERVAIRRRRCKIRKYLAVSLENMNVDLYNIIVDYMFVNRKILDFLYKIATSGGTPVPGMDPYLDKGTHRDAHIKLVNSRGIDMQHTIHMATSFIDLRICKSRYFEAWEFTCLEKPEKLQQYYTSRDEEIMYINYRIQP